MRKKLKFPHWLYTPETMRLVQREKSNHAFSIVSAMARATLGNKPNLLGAYPEG
jgi:hypothetical protein